MKNYAKVMEHVPEPLPIAPVEDKRNEACMHYANKIWRYTDLKIITAMLENLYEQAYSKGLKDMDKMHGQV